MVIIECDGAAEERLTRGRVRPARRGYIAGWDGGVRQRRNASEHVRGRVLCVDLIEAGGCARDAGWERRRGWEQKDQFRTRERSRR